MDHVQNSKNILVEIGELYQDLRGNCAGQSDEDKAKFVKECIINVRKKKQQVESDLESLLLVLNDKEINYLSRINAW